MQSSAWDGALARLQRLGLSGYEAKAYLTLLTADGPQSGYETAKVSGVPRGAIYEVLGKLQGRGLVFEARADAGTARYLGLPLAAFASRTRRELDDALEGLREAVPAIRQPSPASLTHNLTGLAVVRERARDLVRGAREALLLFVWPEDLEPLEADLREAERRGVEISLISTAPIPSIGHSFSHQLTSPDVILQRMGCRLLVLAADRAGALIAGTEDGETWGLYSEDRAVVLLAEEYVRHDIGLKILVDRLGRDTLASVWNEDPAVRRLVTGSGRLGRPGGR